MEALKKENLFGYTEEEKLQLPISEEDSDDVEVVVGGGGDKSEAYNRAGSMVTKSGPGIVQEIIDDDSDNDVDGLDKSG